MCGPIIERSEPTKPSTTFANGHLAVSHQRARIDPLSGEPVQRELTFYRAKRAIIIPTQTRFRARSNCLRRTTLLGCVCRELTLLMTGEGRFNLR
jgi:hypothetical protein